MKKNINFIPMDSILETWLLEKLMKGPSENDRAEDLLSGIRDMLDGEVSSSLLSPSNETEAPVPVPLDGMRLGELEIYPKDRGVVVQGVEVSLTPKEFGILYFLAQNQGGVFIKEQIYWAVRVEDYLLGDGNIMALIRKLRKEIEPDPDTSEYILTIWDIGYRFNDQF